MREKIKIVLSGFVFMMFVIFPCRTALAMDHITLPAMKDAVTVTFHADVPEGFARDIEIFLNGSPYYMTAQSGYTTAVSLEPDHYEIKVILTDDIMNQYQTNYVESFDSKTTKDITIRIIHSLETELEEEGEEHLLSDIDGLDNAAKPQEFDFSEGKDYGTLLISREQYGAIKSATFRLIGNDTVYDISLDRDNVGQAKVLLPAGDYYESGTIDVELAPDAFVPSDTQFLWQHKGNLGNWGNYYMVSAGETKTIDDLIIMTSTGNRVFEVDSSLLFSKAYHSNYESLAESHRQEALESAFPEKYETTESETIPTVIPVKSSKTPYFTEIVTFVIIVAVLMFFIAIVKLKFSKSKKSGKTSKR